MIARRRERDGRSPGLTFTGYCPSDAQWYAYTQTDKYRTELVRGLTAVIDAGIGGWVAEANFYTGKITRLWQVVTVDETGVTVRTSTDRDPMKYDPSTFVKADR
jgi:hypothetical protein